MSPQTETHKDSNNNDLEQGANSAYTPAYKDCFIDENIPVELAEIIAVWPELPEHIKQTIETLVGSVTDTSKEISP